MKNFSSIFISIWLLALSTSPIAAQIDPPLFSCVTPVGSVSAEYSSGTHGIVGDTQTYTGSDSVYTIDQNHVLQCFCPAEGTNGIQSNWWLLDDVGQEEIDFFIRRGWILVPDGSLWGLRSASYLVKNDTFTCSGTGGGGNSGGSSSNSSSSNSDNSGTGGSVSNTTQARGGYVLGADTLAATGSVQKIWLTVILGVTSAFLAIKLSRVD
jgi:uncharacterized membrane protein YgcG